MLMKSKRPKHFLLLVLLALLLPQTALADNINESRHYLVTMAGLDQLRIEFPIYDEESYDAVPFYFNGVHKILLHFYVLKTVRNFLVVEPVGP